MDSWMEVERTDRRFDGPMEGMTEQPIKQDYCLVIN
jgi:hypothetical protein